LGGAEQHLKCARAAYDKKEQTPLPPAFVGSKAGHTRWIYSADLSVFNRHTSQEASVVMVKG
jgi:hypothetical protein